MKKYNIIIPVFKKLVNTNDKIEFILSKFKKEESLNIYFIGNKELLPDSKYMIKKNENITFKMIEKKSKNPNDLIKKAFEIIEILDTFVIDVENLEFSRIFNKIHKHSKSSKIVLIKQKVKNPFFKVVDFVYDVGVKIMGLKKDNKAMNLFQFFSCKDTEYIKNNNKFNAYLRNFDVWGYNYVTFLKLNAGFKDENNTLKYWNGSDKKRVVNVLIINLSLPMIVLTILFGGIFLNSILYLSTVLLFFVMLSVGTYGLINEILKFRLDKVE